MNIFVPLTSLISIILLSTPYLVFKLLSWIKRSITSENVAGKVVLITGASSGIGEYLCYEYAKRGARLALAARREDRLQVVANKAREMGSPDVIVIRMDVSKIQDCKQGIERTVNHFGQLDHLVNNAGINQALLFEDCTNISEVIPIMDINFWGAAYCTHFALPHLKQSKGKIVVIASIAAWASSPSMIFYNASKGALVSFFETLRVECGSKIGGVTIVTPGVIESEMTTPENLSKFGLRDFPPIQATDRCAEAIVKSACRGDKYLTDPSWVGAAFLFKLVCPEVFDWVLRWNYGVRVGKKHHKVF